MIILSVCFAEAAFPKSIKAKRMNVRMYLTI